MMDALHACLDGELPREALAPAEQEELARFEALILEVADHVRVSPPPDLVARVLRALPEPVPRPRLAARLAARCRSATAWFWQPTQISLQLRPAFALAAAAVTAILALGPVRAALTSPGTAAATDAAAATVYVQFRLDASDVSHVALAGSFTDWEPRYQLQESAPGVWSVVVPLAPGVHDYTFLVDGSQWVPDPHAFQVDDSFGGVNSRLSLLAPAGEV